MSTTQPRPPFPQKIDTVILDTSKSLPITNPADVYHQSLIIETNERLDGVERELRLLNVNMIKMLEVLIEIQKNTTKVPRKNALREKAPTVVEEAPEDSDQKNPRKNPV